MSISIHLLYSLFSMNLKRLCEREPNIIIHPTRKSTQDICENK